MKIIDTPLFLRGTLDICQYRMGRGDRARVAAAEQQRPGTRRCGLRPAA